jgi:hypothetical protein
MHKQPKRTKRRYRETHVRTNQLLSQQFTRLFMHFPIHQSKAPTRRKTTTTTKIVEVFDSGGEGLGGWSPTALWRSGFGPRPVYAR